MRLSVLLASAALALAACRASDPPPPPVAPPEPAEAAAPMGPPPPPMAGTLPMGIVTAAELATQIRDLPGDVKVVNFWATWCGPCREELPDFLAVADSLSGQGVTLALLSVDTPDMTAQALDVVNGLGASGIVPDNANWIKSPSETDEAFAAGVSPRWKGDLPVTALYDRSGTQRAFLLGRTSRADLVRAIDAVRAGR